MTTALGGSTTVARPPAPATRKIKAEYQEAEILPSPTLDRTTAAQSSNAPKPAKSTRRKAPLPKKPQVKLTTVQPMIQEDTRVSQTADNTTVQKAGPPTHLRIASGTLKNSIHPHNTFESSTDGSMASIYTSNGYFSPLDAIDTQSTTSCSVSYNDYSDPLSTEVGSPYEKNLDFESERPSSPASNDIRGPSTAQVQSLADSNLSSGLPLLSAGMIQSTTCSSCLILRFHFKSFSRVSLVLRISLHRSSHCIGLCTTMDLPPIKLCSPITLRSFRSLDCCFSEYKANSSGS